jgi:hypothetical protein
MAVKKMAETRPEVSALARAVGLAKAAQQFPQDVAVAIKSAEQTRAALGELDDVVAEPWPPMRVRGMP